jgi:hypothetical protein
LFDETNPHGVHHGRSGATVVTTRHAMDTAVQATAGTICVLSVLLDAPIG